MDCLFPYRCANGHGSSLIGFDESGAPVRGDTSADALNWVKSLNGGPSSGSGEQLVLGQDSEWTAVLLAPLSGFGKS